MPANYYRMFPEHHFAYVSIRSEIFSVQEALQLNQEYKTDINYSEIHYLLIMFDERCLPGFSPKDLVKLWHIYAKHTQVNNHKKVVWLVSEPFVTAMAHLFVLYSNELYCSTLEKAYALLDMPIDCETFLKLINNSEHPVV